MFKSIVNAFKTPALRKKILITLLLIVIFRVGCYISIPFVDVINIIKPDVTTTSVEDLINIISGGAFSRLSIFAMSITPYITSSIIVQLLAMIITPLEKMTRDEGERGRKKIDRITKLITVLLASVEALGIYFSYRNQSIFVQEGVLTAFVVVVSLVAGSMLLVWVGDKITSNAILMNRFADSKLEWAKSTVHIGLILTNDILVNDKNLVEYLKKNYPDAIGGEMEGCGLLSNDNKNWILVKAICDFGHDKSNEHQLDAAQHAIEYVDMTLEKYSL